MRKAAPLMFVLMLLFTLPAQRQVSSNSIGQDRGRFAQEGDYLLVLDGNESILYNRGEPIWKETRTTLADGYEVSTFQYDDGSTHYRTYEHNRLASEGTGSQMRYFYYDEAGLLEKTMALDGETIIEMELYTYDVKTKALNSILTITKDGSSISYYGDPVVRPWFSYTKENTFTKVTQLSQDLQVEEVWEGDAPLKAVTVERPPEGGIRLTTVQKGVEMSELYDDAGLLVLSISPSLTTEYQYNEDRTLFEAVEKSKDAQMRIIRYEGGRKVSESLYQNDMLEKEITYHQCSGKVETLYDFGIPYCDITYALDGKRVLSIRYR